MPVKFVFVILPEVHLLDLAGADQVISESIDFGADFTIEYCGVEQTIQSSAGLGINNLKHFSTVVCNPGDYIIIPGSRVKYIQSAAFKKHTDLFAWLQSAHAGSINLVSICVGAFVLAEAGILDNRECTTHFQLTRRLQEQYPLAKVKEHILFTSGEHIHTSAGIASGIDLVLHLVETLTDGFFAHKVARELVIYNRRNSVATQITSYFNYRNHVHAGIHHVQDYIIENIAAKLYLYQLAELANMSERNFTRIFRKEVGISVIEYINTIRLEKIKELMKAPDLSRKQIASLVGLKTEKQIQRLLKK
ncbi:DJ-1/PfpI family protein [Panacibacter sp. DH6]|uniref:DJ-1/PfpI family protein n=1 Tax=Panacibacter microcysteis TaxID=2793269 RepID=A0A931E8X1_9BACT|nr:DJ-1/PfpI family protein [Panacibacter microcysteis]MBG9376374.1 DJ-1/PfpI family protein [Panacibacter microcysteis]